MKYKAFISYKHGDDDALAISLEKALEKFAKPIFRRRALEIFRDGNDLSAAADLGEKIRSGLKNSEFMICMASPKYAASKWCCREAEFWRDHKSIDNFLIVLTDGEILWDESTNDFDWNVTTAIPKELSGTFKGEPFYIDFRNAGPAEQLNLDNPDFKKRLVLLAATLHGKSIGDMVGEAVKQHKRTMRIRNTAISVIMLFMGLSLFLTILSNRRKSASLLHFQAKAIEATDPSLALRLEEEAMAIYDNIDFKKSAYDIISNNAFYKILSQTDSIAYSSMDVSQSDNTILLANDLGTIRYLDSTGQLRNEFHLKYGDINAIRFAPDGNSFAIATKNFAHQLDLNGGVIQSYVSENEELNNVVDLTFSPDNSMLATVSDQVLSIWDINGSIQAEIVLPFLINAVAFSPDNSSLLIGFNGGSQTAQLLDLEGNLLLSLGHYDVVNSVAFSPDGQTIVTGSWDNTAKLWDLQANLIQQFNHRSNEMLPDQNSPLKATFSPDGQFVLTSSWENKAKLWNLKGNLIKEFKGHTNQVQDINFMSDGKTIVTNSFDRTVRRWHSQGLTGTLEASFQAHKDRINNITFLSEDRFISSSEDTSIKIWNLNGELLNDLEGHQAGIISTTVLADQDAVLTAARDGKVKRWDLNGNLGLEISTKSFVTDLVLAPNGRSMIVSDLNEGSNVYDLNMNKIFDLGHTRTVAYSPNSQFIVSGHADGASLWTLEGELLYNFTIPQANIEAVAFSEDSKQLLICASDRKARLYDVDGKLLSEFIMNEVKVSHAAFAPNAEAILIGSVDSYLTYKGSGLASVGLWHPDGTLMMSLDHNGLEATAMAFSPNATLIALGYANGSLHLFSKSSIDDYLKHHVQPLSEKHKKDYDL